jgi:hypothetical protein
MSTTSTDEKTCVGDVDSTRPVTDITLIQKVGLCRQLDVSGWTLDRWIKQGLFPPPFYVTPSSPATWRMRVIAAFLEKRRRARRVKPKPRGALKQQRDQAGE